VKMAAQLVYRIYLRIIYGLFDIQLKSPSTMVGICSKSLVVILIS